MWDPRLLPFESVIMKKILIDLLWLVIVIGNLEEGAEDEYQKKEAGFIGGIVWRS